MQDQNKYPHSREIACRNAPNHFAQSQAAKEEFYQIPKINQLEGFKGKYDFILPFTLFFEETDEDSEEEHARPLNFVHIQKFQDFQFDFVRASDKFGFEIYIYIFYNIGDQRRQLESAIKLYSMEMRLHRELLVWAQCIERDHWSYFDTKKWKNRPLRRKCRQADFFNLEELEQALRQL